MQTTAGRWNASPLTSQTPLPPTTASRRSLACVLVSFGIAYRMLGSAAEAEDIVQDVWVRWQTADRSVVRDAAAFLVTTTTRLAINVMQSARSRRETYVGPWLPEPVDTSVNPRLRAERGQALAFGVLVLLETLIAHRTSGLHPSGGVRLSVPRHRERPSA